MYTLQKPWQPGFLQGKQATAHLWVHVCTWQPRYVPKDDVIAPTQSGPSPPHMPSPSGVRDTGKDATEHKVGGPGGLPDLGGPRCGLALGGWLAPFLPRVTAGISACHPSVLPQDQASLSGLNRKRASQETLCVLGTVCTDPGALGHHQWRGWGIKKII